MKHIKPPNYSLIERIGRMYYILGMNQQTIADKMNISRTSVVRLLSEGRELGIIKIYVRSQFDDLRNAELENQLAERFRMKDIVITRNIDPMSIYAVAAQYVEGILPKYGNIALSGGFTVNHIANYFHTTEAHDSLNIAQLTGVFGDRIPSLSVAQKWAERLNANPMYLSAPGIVCTPEKRDMFLNDFNNINTYKAICNAGLAVVGIGIPKMVVENISQMGFSDELLKNLDKTCAGDVMFHFYNEKGDFCADEISKRVVGATILDFLRIPTRIAVAFGKEKAVGIASAMKGGIVNVMITDEETATQILSIYPDN